MFFSLVVNNLVKVESGKHLKEGIDLVTKATEEDLKQNYDEALLLYKKGVQSLLATVKYDDAMTHKKAEVVRVKCSKFLERADEIKAHIDELEKSMADKLSGVTTSTSPPKNFRLTNVIGLDEAKEKLINLILIPLKYPLLLKPERRKLCPSKGILVIGPWGTGKSLLSKAIAGEADNSNFLSLSAEQIALKWIGECGMKLVQKLFDFARTQAPTIIFIDDVDEIYTAAAVQPQDQDGDGDGGGGEEWKKYDRDRKDFFSEFQKQMALAERDKIFVQLMAATSAPSILDDEVLQLFGQIVETKLPKMGDRIKMMKKHLSDFSQNLQEFDFELLGRRTKGYSGANMVTFMQEACIQPIRRIQKATHFEKIENPQNGVANHKLYPCVPETVDAIKLNWMDIPHDQLGEPGHVTMDDLLTTLSRSKASVSGKELNELKAFVKRFQNKGKSSQDPVNNDCAVV